jgi:hypothetical protein
VYGIPAGKCGGMIQDNKISLKMREGTVIGAFCREVFSFQEQLIKA